MTKETVEDLSVRQSVHEAVCGERYGTIISRIGRLEAIIIGSFATLLIGMGTTIVSLVAYINSIKT